MDSFFCDSFEIAPLPNSLLWSDDTLAGFEKHSGYDFTKFLPTLWCDVGAPTPRVRYDLGNYLSDLGLEVFFKTFNDWCDAHHMQARIQPHYRFTEELVAGAGALGAALARTVAPCGSRNPASSLPNKPLAMSR